MPRKTQVRPLGSACEEPGPGCREVNVKVGESSLLMWSRSWARHGAAAAAGAWAAILARWEVMFMSLWLALLGLVVEDADDLRGGTVFSTAREVRLAFIQLDP
jgi:hypothetical protein